jgi:hypothetical protein
MRLWRRGSRREAASGLTADSHAVGRALDDAAGPASAGEGSLDLEQLVAALFDAEPTSDIAVLRARGVEASAFFDAELRPNWEELSRPERAAKTEAFIRLANAVGGGDPAGIGAVVRTKVLVLAWAYDRVYGQGLLREVARDPHQDVTV